MTGGESQKGATKLKALERKAGSTRKSSVSNDVKVKKNRPAGLVTNKSVKGCFIYELMSVLSQFSTVNLTLNDFHAR